MIPIAPGVYFSISYWIPGALLSFMYFVYLNNVISSIIRCYKDYITNDWQEKTFSIAWYKDEEQLEY